MSSHAIAHPRPCPCPRHRRNELVIFIIALAIVLAALAERATAQNKVYWTEAGQIEARIRRANLDGTSVQTLLFDPVGSGTGNAQLSFPTSIQLDRQNQQMFWVDFGLDRISRASFTGAGVQTVFQAASTASLRASTLDVPNNRLYYSNFGNDTISRVNFDGTGNTTILTLPSASIPLGLSLDAAAGHIYFTDNGANMVRRVNLDGTGLVDLVTTGLDNPVNVQLDPINGKMYWVDFGNSSVSNSGRIERANLDGSNRQTLISNLPLPEDIALDVLAGQMYWTDGIADQILRANLDGTNVQVAVSGNGIDFPFSLALDVAVPEPTGAMIALLSGALIVRRRRRLVR